MKDDKITVRPAPAAATTTLVLQIAHAYGRKVTPVEARFARRTKPDAPLTDELTIGEQREPIDFGRLVAPWLFAVVNRAGLELQQQFPEAREAVDLQLVYLGTEAEPDALIVYPWGGAQIVHPKPGVVWYWRAAVGSVPVELFAAE